MVFEVKVRFVDRKLETRVYKVLADSREEAKEKGIVSWVSDMVLRGKKESAVISDVIVFQPDTFESENKAVFDQLRMSMQS